MPIVFWYITYIITSKKYYKSVMEKIQSYVLPNTNIQSENLFDVPGLLADPLLQACFQETLRLRTQNGSIRIVNEATTLPVHGKEYYLRKNSFVFIIAPLIHMDPEIYSNVTEFQPERFLGADLESTLVATGQHAIDIDTKVAKKSSTTPKFYKNGVPVRHYMMPFGGGDNLVCNLCL
jgi:cytochrome P450